MKRWIWKLSLALVAAGVSGCGGAEPAPAPGSAWPAPGWAVLQFHGVGGDYLTVSEEAHEALRAYLESQRYHVWTAPFGAVAARLRSVRAGR